MEEIARSELLTLATAFSFALNVSLATLGQRCLNDNSFFTRISSGSNFTLRTYDRVVLWFSANWPDDVAWPAEVARPDRAVRHEAAQ